MAESKGKDWRELCAAAAQEPDSEKLVSLVNQILQAFDERDQKSSSPPDPLGLARKPVSRESGDGHTTLSQH
jgi:hypothetical protein